MIINFENVDDPEADRCTKILTTLFLDRYPGYSILDEDREEKLVKFGIWFEEFAPCKIKMSSEGIESIEIEEKDYLMLVLKHSDKEERYDN